MLCIGGFRGLMMGQADRECILAQARVLLLPPTNWLNMLDNLANRGGLPSWSR